MTIFAVAMTGILALLHSTISSSLVSRHEIIAANLAREQIELIRNARNTNIRNYTDWDRLRIGDDGSGFLTGWVFLIENDYTSSGTIYSTSDGNITNSPIKISSLSFFPGDTLETKFNTSQLYLDSLGRYTHSDTGSGTLYASYMIVSPLKFEASGTTIEPKDGASGRNQWYIIDARVIVKSRGYTEYDMKTIITDWKK